MNLVQTMDNHHNDNVYLFVLFFYLHVDYYNLLVVLYKLN